LYSCIFVPPNSATSSSFLASLSGAGKSTSTISVVKSTPSGSAVVVGLQSAASRERASWLLLCTLGLLVGASGL
jgi:hypothetical protein